MASKIQGRAEHITASDVPKMEPARFSLIQQGIVRPSSKEYHQIYNADRRVGYQEAREMEMTIVESRAFRSLDSRERYGAGAIIQKIGIEEVRRISEELSLDVTDDIFAIYKEAMGK